MLATITAVGFWESDLFSVDGKVGERASLPLNSATVQHQFAALDAAFRQIKMDPRHPKYPKPSDLKILRNDTIAALILCREMADFHQWSTAFKENGALLVANSNFIDDDVLDFEGISMAIGELQSAADQASENKLFGAGVSPLLPLRTLTNGAQSFIAQYLSFLGSSTTYGSTGIATVQALHDACNLLKIGTCEAALVGGAHYANLFSFVNNCLLLTDSQGYAEASATSFFMLEPYNAGSKGEKRLHVVERLEGLDSLKQQQVDWLFYGGAFTPAQDSELLSCCSDLTYGAAFSWFEHTGNLGAAELGMLLAAAVSWLDAAQTAIVLIKDAYDVVEILKVQKA